MYSQLFNEFKEVCGEYCGNLAHEVVYMYCIRGFRIHLTLRSFFDSIHYKVLVSPDLPFHVLDTDFFSSFLIIIEPFSLR
jgi:hypothetical protein